MTTAVDPRRSGWASAHPEVGASQSEPEDKIIPWHETPTLNEKKKTCMSWYDYYDVHTFGVIPFGSKIHLQKNIA